jgi:hypothetical protein
VCHLDLQIVLQEWNELAAPGDPAVSTMPTPDFCSTSRGAKLDDKDVNNSVNFRYVNIYVLKQTTPGKISLNLLNLLLFAASYDKQRFAKDT